MLLVGPSVTETTPAVPSLLHVIVDKTGSGNPWTTFIPVLVAVGALIGVILNIMSTARLQRKNRELDRDNQIRVVRSVVFAQLSRVYRTIQGEYEYLVNSKHPWIWIALYGTLLPSEDNLSKIQVLTAEEVLDITAFLYSYHEHMGYIAALSGGRDKTNLKYDFQLVGVDYADPRRELLWLLKSLTVIERKASAAMKTILRGAEKYGEADALRERLTAEWDQSERIAREADEYKKKLIERVGEDFTLTRSASGISEEIEQAITC